MSHVRKALGQFRWQDVDLLEYKPVAELFEGVTRQKLFGAGPGFGGELRYFEIAAGGHSTLERHQHAHAVIVIRGRGRVFVGEEIAELGEMDLVSIPPATWHQFRAADDEVLGFLCAVDGQRDRPELPGEAALKALRQDPQIRLFIRV